MSAFTTPKIKLEYFPISGVVERVRLALAMNDIPFDVGATPTCALPTLSHSLPQDVRIPFNSEWLERKKTAKYGQLPIMTLPDGREIYQSDAMLRWAGARGKGDLYPCDPDVRLKVDEALGVAADLVREWRPCIYVGMKPEKFGVDPAAKDATVKVLRENFMGEPMGRYMGFIKDMIDANGGTFLTGDFITIADLDMYVSVRYYSLGVADHVPKDCLDAYPEVKAWIARVEAEPRVAAYYASLKK